MQVLNAMKNGGATAFDANIDTSSGSGRSDNHEFDPMPSSVMRHQPFKLYIHKGDPVGTRLMLAISSDGKEWIKTGEVIVNHAGVPCLAVEENEQGVETLYLFCCVARGTITASNSDDIDPDALSLRPTPLAVAYTTNLITWTYRLLGDTTSGFEYPTLAYEDYHMVDGAYSANDPSVVRGMGRQFDSKRWLLYYTLHYGQHPTEAGGTDTSGSMILVAEADHLYDFTWKTRADVVPVIPTAADLLVGKRAEDPSALPLGPGLTDYVLFAGGNTVDYNWKADLGRAGMTLRDLSEFQVTCDAPPAEGDRADEPILMNNAVDAPGTSLHRTWIACAGQDPHKYIVSVPIDGSGDIEGGTYSTGGCDKLIEQDQVYEHNGIREAAVARFGGCWVMVYTTSIPATEFSLPEGYIGRRHRPDFDLVDKDYQGFPGYGYTHEVPYHEYHIDYSTRWRIP